MTDAVVLGSGMAALGAAYALAEAGAAFDCYDQHEYYGGHTATYSPSPGFIFDEGPHVSFTKNERVAELLAANVDHDYRTVPAYINNYWQGHWFAHPAQCNLHGLPVELIVRIIEDFVAVQEEDQSVEPRNYADWLRSSYGRTFAETLPMVYNRKYHTTSTENLTTDWLGPRMYRPSLGEVLQGALGTPPADVHYVTSFRYPTRGGFSAYLRPFADRFPPRLKHRVVGIDPRLRRLRFANGISVDYRELLSSMPLPELIACMSDTPEEVRAAAARLAFTSAVLVNVGVDRPDISAAHFTYFYDPDIIFSRLSFPHLFSPHTVPPGASGIQAEIYFSDKYQPLERTPTSLIAPVLADLRKCGVIDDGDRILMTEARLVRYANVIYDFDRAEAVQLIHAYLDERGVHYCGRYGDWNHDWTDEAFVSGERAAQAAVSRSRPGPA